MSDVNLKEGVILITRSEPPCSGCVTMKNMLNGLGVEFTSLDISNGGAKYATARMAVPTVLVKGNPVLYGASNMNNVKNTLKREGVI